MNFYRLRITGNTGMKLDFSAMRPCLIFLVLGWAMSASLYPGEPKNALADPIQHLTDLPFPMPGMALPQVPDRQVNITDFGAVGNGQARNTEAFRQAIAACSLQGGGRVVVPAGIWLTGPIQLASRIELHLQRNALLLFSRNPEDYPLVETSFEGARLVRFLSPIYGKGLTDVAITGPGMVDGSGDAWRPVKKSKMTSNQWRDLLSAGGVVAKDKSTWWPSAEAMKGADIVRMLQKKEPAASLDEYRQAREYLRPVLVGLVDCKRVLLDGPTFANSPAWNIHPLNCEDVVLRNLTVRNPWYSQNGDGLDLESCTRAVVYNCTFDVGDDAICIKSGKDEYGRKRGVPTEWVSIADCTVYHGHGGFTIGSEMSGGVRHINVRNCTFIGTDMGLRFKSTRGRGGIVEKIYIQSIFMKDIPTDAVGFNMYYGGEAPDESIAAKRSEALAAANEGTPQFRDIFLKNIFCRGAARAIAVQGLPEMAIRNISLEDVTISSRKGFICTDAEGISLKRVKILAQEGPLFIVDQGQNILLEKINDVEGLPALLQLKGDKTSGVRLVDCPAKDCRQRILSEAGVSPAALKIQ
jgi:polygalacturonase